MRRDLAAQEIERPELHFANENKNVDYEHQGDGAYRREQERFAVHQRFVIHERIACVIYLHENAFKHRVAENIARERAQSGDRDRQNKIMPYHFALSVTGRAKSAYRIRFL